jgi:DNA phosphorothioation system restriction enzyme
MQYLQSFRDLQIPCCMDTSGYDLVEQFFTPLLLNSVRYDRGVGFFSSGWLKVHCKGMSAFADHGGRARWITSPILDKNDWDALLAGEAARVDWELREALEHNISDLAEALDKDTLSALAWMVADEVISFKLALPRDKLDNGNFHDKFGIFADSYGNQISFNGSYNDSIQGLRNYESIKVFYSWDEETNWVQMDVERFEKLWNNFDPNVRVFHLPEAAREKILRLRIGERPYAEPEWVKLRRQRENPTMYIAVPFLPEGLILRDYQQKAINAWFSHNCQGLLEMATGTGKTITALAASVRLFNRERQLAVIITAPYQHLVDQWQKEISKFGYRAVLAYKNKRGWLDELNDLINDYNAGYRSSISVITTHATFINTTFKKSIARLKEPSMLIADEAHHLGAERSRWSYPEHVPFRLALSATPERWFDEGGTQALKEYFGETVFSFPLEKAIGVSLTPYYYYPHLVSLTDEELDEYQELFRRIARLINEKDEQKQRTLEMLLIKRAKLLNNAKNKLPCLSNLIDKKKHIEHTLFYCSPEQIDDVTRLLGWEKKLIIHRFTAQESTKERHQLLADFARGKLQALVAMKCLDEGVDVPNTSTAYILASSGNSREFIQRRGRILRKAPGKEYSCIHDLIAVPPLDLIAHESSTFDAERTLMRRELQRFKEFASLARNKYQAIEVVWDIAKRYGLIDF